MKSAWGRNDVVKVLTLAVAALAAACESGTAPEAQADQPIPVSRSFSVTTSGYTGTDLGGTSPSLAWGINDHRQVVGETQAPGLGGAMQPHPFSWAGGTMTLLNLSGLPGVELNDESIARDVNNGGQIVGYYRVSGTGNFGFRWDGKAQRIGRGVRGRARAIGENGHIVGWTRGTMNTRVATLFTRGANVQMPFTPGFESRTRGVNARGHVVGWMTLPNGDIRAFFWDGRSAPRDLGTLGGSESRARGINDAGKVVGISTDAAGVVHAVAWENGTIVDLGPGEAHAVNQSGAVAGTSGGNAVVWEGSTMTILSPAGVGRAINNNGDVAGSAVVGGQRRAMLWTKN